MWIQHEDALEVRKGDTIEARISHNELIGWDLNAGLLMLYGNSGQEVFVPIRWILIPNTIGYLLEKTISARDGLSSVEDLQNVYVKQRTRALQANQNNQAA